MIFWPLPFLKVYNFFQIIWLSFKKTIELSFSSWWKQIWSLSFQTKSEPQSLFFNTRFVSPFQYKNQNNELTVITKSIFLTRLPILPFPVTDGKFYLETPFPGRSRIRTVWRLLPVTYNGYGCQHQKHGAKKLLIHCLSPEMKANTKC